KAELLYNGVMEQRLNFLTVEECRLIIRRFIEGQSLEKLARSFRVSIHRIKRVISLQTRNAKLLVLSPLARAQLQQRKAKLVRSNRGTRNINARLTEAAVLKIKRLLAAGKHSKTRLAEMFNVTTTTIGMIERGQSWSWLKPNSKPTKKEAVNAGDIGVSAYTAPQAASKLGLAPDTIYMWIRRGWIRGRKVGSYWYFTTQQVNAAIAKYGTVHKRGRKRNNR
ncbi:MAG: helix-turn-helix domain-containing protein, partial [Acidobacteriota bacterium]